MLSASHNPGGPEGDFGIKSTPATAAPAPEPVTEAIYARARAITEYRILDAPDLDLDRIGEATLGAATVSVIDPVADYAALMESLIDFPAIRALFAGGFRMRFDAMSAVTGPYATEILERRLGAPAGTVVNAEPLPDFGGHHPDPNPVHAHDLMVEMTGPGRSGFRCRLGRRRRPQHDRRAGAVRDAERQPRDPRRQRASAPGYAAGLAGVARSMPTSRAVDRVAARAGIPAFETPTGWKFFGNLLDAGRINPVRRGERRHRFEPRPREDGLWAVLLWLNVLAATGEPADGIVRAHWRDYGRDYYARHDYEEVDAAAAEGLMQALRDRLDTLPGQSFAGLTVESADDFAYTDPVDGSVTKRQGIRILFREDARVVLRLSGTGTVGATLRVYLERYEPDPAKHDAETAGILAPVVAAAEAIADIRAKTGRDAPSVVT